MDQLVNLNDADSIGGNALIIVMPNRISLDMSANEKFLDAVGEILGTND